MSTTSRSLITAALPYANGPLHIGHIAGAYLHADIYARHMRRVQGPEQVLFVCGSDEHGTSIEILARQQGRSPQAVVDEYHTLLQRTFAQLGMSFDVYGRTSDAAHTALSQQLFLQMYEKGYLTPRTTQQYYDTQAEMFLADRYIRGECPHCGYTDAYGDQCEKCGSSLSPDELLSPRSAVSDGAIEKRDTTHWYLSLDSEQAWLEQWLLQDPVKQRTWKKPVLGQCSSWLSQGLVPRSMTRDMQWGVPVPLPDAEGKVLYVWFDAPIGYMTATKQYCQAHGLADWQRWWCDEDTAITHFIGKDNIVFHCIIFPAMLHMLGGYNPPTNVPANEFLNLEGKKLSTSRRWAVWVHEYLADFADEDGDTALAADMLRYVLCATMPELKDTNFTWEGFQSRVNTELVDTLGNFIHRTLTLCHKYGIHASQLASPDPTVTQRVEALRQGIAEAIEAHEYKQALANFMEIAQTGNELLTRTEPWKLQKTAPDEARAVLQYCRYIVEVLADQMALFLPHSAEKLQKMLQSSETPVVLFRKVSDEEIAEQREKLQPSTS